MRRVLESLRYGIGCVIGLFTATAAIRLVTRMAVGDGVATAAVDSTFTPLIVVLGWFTGGALGCWVASRVAKSHSPAIIVAAWLFSMVWLSPGVRPASLGLRLVSAIAVGIGGFGASQVGRLRQPTETPQHAKMM